MCADNRICLRGGAKHTEREKAEKQRTASEKAEKQRTASEKAAKQRRAYGKGEGIRRGRRRRSKEQLSKSHATEKNSLPKQNKKGGIHIYIYIYINYRGKRAWVGKMREAKICRAVVKAVV